MERVFILNQREYDAQAKKWSKYFVHSVYAKQEDANKACMGLRIIAEAKGLTTVDYQVYAYDVFSVPNSKSITK